MKVGNPLPLGRGGCQRAGIIEKWGTGTLNILGWCQGNSNPQPKWEERTHSVVMTFYPSVALNKEEKEGDLRPKSRPETIEEVIVKLLTEEGAMSSSEIAYELGHEKVSGAIKRVIKSLLERKKIAYTVPNKPRSRMQKYVIRSNKK